MLAVLQNLAMSLKQKINGFGSFYMKNFCPKLVEVLRKGYDKDKFRRDTLAGMTVAVVSIPLAIALAIASGVTPAQGLYTAIVAGFFIALLGGSKYQIGGPTGAFVVVIFNVIKNYGPEGLTMTMLVAGIILIIAGLLRLGTYIKYIPYPVVTGFTAGILCQPRQLQFLVGLHCRLFVCRDFLRPAQAPEPAGLPRRRRRRHAAGRGICAVLRRAGYHRLQIRCHSALPACAETAGT